MIYWRKNNKKKLIEEFEKHEKGEGKPLPGMKFNLA